MLQKMSFHRASRDDIEYLFNTLEHVKSGDRTVWNIVYDIPNRKVHFKSLIAPAHKHVEFDSFEFDCNSPVFVLNINTDKSGNVVEYFKEYSFNFNYDYLLAAVRSTDFLKHMSDESIEAMAKYPDFLRCME